MNFLTAPTDSLYKFMAIAGLISMAGGIILFFGSIDNVDELVISYQEEVRILQQEITIMTEEFHYSKNFKLLADSFGFDLEDFLRRVENSASQKDTIYKEILYNLPDSISNTFKQILLKNEILANKNAQIKHLDSAFNPYYIGYLILLYGGEAFAVIGFGLWYDKIQKPLNITEQNKLLSEDQWQSNCQSCYMTIRLMSERATESDGKFKRSYCNNCYQNGNFVEPNLSFAQAHERLIDEFKKRNYDRLRVYVQSRKLKKCIRWASKRKW